MKIPKPILLYLLTLEVLPILDELQGTNSIKKSFRNINGLAEDMAANFEAVPLSSELKENVHHNFTKLMGLITMEDLTHPIGVIEGLEIKLKSNEKIKQNNKR